MGLEDELGRAANLFVDTKKGEAAGSIQQKYMEYLNKVNFLNLEDMFRNIEALHKLTNVQIPDDVVTKGYRICFRNYTRYCSLGPDDFDEVIPKIGDIKRWKKITKTGVPTDMVYSAYKDNMENRHFNHFVELRRLTKIKPLEEDVNAARSLYIQNGWFYHLEKLNKVLRETERPNLKGILKGLIVRIAYRVAY